MALLSMLFVDGMIAGVRISAPRSVGGEPGGDGVRRVDGLAHRQRLADLIERVAHHGERVGGQRLAGDTGQIRAE